MSTHPSMSCHEPAPIPNMQVQSAIPAKRGPEDDVQFVSIQPVKKARGSRESSPAQIQPTPDRSSAHPQGQDQRLQTDDDHLWPGNTDVAGRPQPKLSTSNRGVSFPGLENYVFPPGPHPKPSRTSRSSPVLSPRQLPQLLLPNQVQDTMQAPQGFRGLVSPPQFQMPWGMTALYPQTEPRNAGVPSSRPVPLAPSHLQQISTDSAMDIDDQPLSMSSTLRKPELPSASIHVSQPELQRMPKGGQDPKPRVETHFEPERQVKTAQTPSDQDDHGPVKTVQNTSPRQETRSQLQTPSHAQTDPPTPTATHTQARTPANAANNHNTVKGPQGSTVHQTPPPKGPCFICEQMRQQVLFNQANGLPIAHLPQMQHGWHGQGPIPQMHMGHSNAGYSMMPNMLQNLQQRFQPIPLGHLPLGYGMQTIPVQVQLQMQRQNPALNMTGDGPSQGVLAQSQQSQQTQGQQIIGQISQLASGQPPPYTQSQSPSPSQAMMTQRPMMMHQQALVLPPPTPSPQPPQPAPAPQATLTPQASTLPKPKTHSPNLIVDIAESCEELFPWDEVAKRHGVTRVKVVETFGAIIQLPLLRCTTDKKRHGKLATSRLREYTKAKKDVEAANAASTVRSTAAASTLPTSAAPGAPSQVAQVQAHRMSAKQAQSPMKQTQEAQSQATHAQAMHAQVSQIFANQGHISQIQYPPQQGQAHASQDGNTVSGVFEMANTMSPLGLPSNLTQGLGGHWQRQ